MVPANDVMILTFLREIRLADQKEPEPRFLFVTAWAENTGTVESEWSGLDGSEDTATLAGVATGPTVQKFGSPAAAPGRDCAACCIAGTRSRMVPDKFPDGSG